MITCLQKPPKFWLNLNNCRVIYNRFKTSVYFRYPLPNFESRYENVLETVLGAVKAGYDGQPLYPTLLDVAAAYLVKFNCRHPFLDGNKRFSIAFTDAYLLLHDVNLVLTHEDMYTLAATIARIHDDDHVSEDVLISVCKKIISDFSVDLYKQK